MKELKDYSQTTINLSDDSWSHIQSGHAEITLSIIEKTLLNPFEVRESIQATSSLLYYSLKINTESKVRYICVVVKTTTLGERYIQTAMTTSYLKAGRVVFKEK